MTKVLIVIVNYNGLTYLRDCLESLAVINYLAGQSAVLVVDNASTDGSVDYLKKDWSKIKLIENQSNIGFAAGNNIGLEYAGSNGFDYAYLLNQDTVVDPSFLAQAVALAQTDSQIAAVQSKLLLYQDKTKINSLGNEIHYLGFAFAGGYKLTDYPLAAREITYASGAAMLLKVPILKEVGFFNPDFFMYHEDVDLGWRLWLSGYKVVLAPDSIVYHKYEFSRSIKKYYYMERNRYLVMLQNYKLATLILIFPAWLVMDLALLFYSFFAGFWRQELSVCFYFFSLKNWAKIITTRRRIQKNRRLSDCEVIKRFVGKIEFQDLKNPLLQYLANPIFNFYWLIIKKIIWW